MLMIDFDNREIHIVSIVENSFISNLPVQREAHWLMVRIFLSSNTAMTMGVVVIHFKVLMVLICSSIGDSDGKSEFHSLFFTFGKQHAVGNAASLGKVLVV